MTSQPKPCTATPQGLSPHSPYEHTNHKAVVPVLWVEATIWFPADTRPESMPTGSTSAKRQTSSSSSFGWHWGRDLQKYQLYSHGALLTNAQPLRLRSPIKR